MRARDLRALAFCVATTAAAGALVWVVTENLLLTAAATAACIALIWTRPRMRRVLRRVRGEEAGWSSYYSDRNAADAFRGPRERESEGRDCTRKKRQRGGKAE